jgi:hypothetical protein
MRSILLACAVLLSACWSYKSSKITAATGGGILLAGIATMAVESATGPGFEADGHAVEGIEVAAGTLLIVGALTAVIGITGVVIHGTDARQQPAPRAALAGGQLP